MKMNTQLLKRFIKKVSTPINYNLYWAYINYRVPRIQKKQEIKVLFVLAELSTWKTELLYLEMLKHPRFSPILGITTSQEAPGSKVLLEGYLKSKNFKYEDLDIAKDSISKINADFVFYYKPYDLSYPRQHVFTKHLKSIPLSIDYGFTYTSDKYYYYRKIFVASFLYFAENNIVKQKKIELLGKKAKNVVVTGVPMQDILLQPKEAFNDPWKDNTSKKRIIYSPHHSIPGTNPGGIEYSTFLSYGEYMLELAQKYKEQITLAFKPHPNLYKKLLAIWGEQRTLQYYKAWEDLENAQVERGDYVDLFKYSDAIINDSCSFVVEYLFVDRPSMFLLDRDPKPILDDLSEFGQMAFKCYDYGSSKELIEQFIVNVINGTDKHKEERHEFRDKYLLPPNNKTACQNIIEAILYSKI